MTSIEYHGFLHRRRKYPFLRESDVCAQEGGQTRTCCGRDRLLAEQTSMKRNAFTETLSTCISLPFHRQVNLANHRVSRLYKEKKKKKKKKNIFLYVCTLQIQNKTHQMQLLNNKIAKYFP